VQELMLLAQRQAPALIMAVDKFCDAQLSMQE
jgi:hypothetical protein